MWESGPQSEKMMKFKGDVDEMLMGHPLFLLNALWTCNFSAFQKKKKKSCNGLPNVSWKNAQIFQTIIIC